MPLPQRWNQKKKNPPAGFSYVETTLEALEHELRDVVQATDPTKRKTESMWPIHQINWQKSRYIYDMYYIHKKISRAVYQYCLDQKIVDAALIAKWKKPGYEKLCSTYVINPSNYKFGTTSICRVPWKDRSEEQKGVHDPTTGCLGCASQDNRNIFGNKYGQYLAAIQLAREERQAQKQQQQQIRQQEENGDDDDEEDQNEEQDETDTNHAKDPIRQQPSSQPEKDDDDGEAPTDDDHDDDDAETDDDEDFGPSPTAGIWAGSKKLELQGEQLTMGADDKDETAGGHEDNDDDAEPPNKKIKH